MKYILILYFFLFSSSFLFSQSNRMLQNPKMINIQDDTIFVMDSHGDYIIKKFNRDGDFLGEAKTDNGKIINWINLNTKKYSRFKFHDYSIYDVIVDFEGNEILSVTQNEKDFFILKNNIASKKIDILYRSNDEIFGFYLDTNNDLYFVLNSSKLCKLTKEYKFVQLFDEPSIKYNGISEVNIKENIGIITSNSTDNLIRVYDNDYNLKFSFGGNKYFETEHADDGGGLVGFDIDKNYNIYTIDWIARRISLFNPVFTNGIITNYKFNKVLIK